MRILLTLLRKDIAGFLRNRSAFALTFLVPIALIYIFGQVFGLTKKGNDAPSGIDLGVVNASADPGAQKLVDALKAEKAFHVIDTYETPDHAKHPLTEEIARQRIQNNRYHFAVVLPADLVSDQEFGLHLKILSDPRNEIETQLVNGLLQKTIFTSVPQLLGQSLQASAKKFLGAGRFDQFNRSVATAVSTAFGGDPVKIQHDMEAGNFGLSGFEARTKPVDPSLRRLDQPTPAAPEGGPSSREPAASPPEKSAAPAVASTPAVADFLKKIVNLETEQVVGQTVKSPAATRVVGGWAIMFLLFAVSGSSAAFFDEKNAGLFQRLLSAPITRAQLLWSRFLFGILLGLVQLITLFTAGSLMYGIDVLGHLGLLVIVCTVAAAACTSFGMLIAAIAPNAQAANGLATFVVMVMSATGGAWFPISLMPLFMQQVGKLTIVYWSMEGFSQVLWAGKPLGELLPTLGVLAGITAGVMAIAIWRLNHKKIFE